jgi:hypothetical protein
VCVQHWSGCVQHSHGCVGHWRHSQVLEWLQEENLRSYAPLFVYNRLDSLDFVSWQDRAAVVWIECRLATIGRRLTRIGRRLNRIGCRLVRIGRRLARIGHRLEENLRSYAPLFVYNRLDCLEYVRETLRLS